MKTTPKKHQREDFENSKDKEAWAHFHEVGCGKTLSALLQAVYLYKGGEIDAMLVVAPPNVHENWITDEMPKHMPDDVPWTGHVYHAGKAKSKKAQQEWRRMFDEPFPVLVITYQAMRTTRGKNDGPKIWVGKDLVKRFLKKRKCFYVGDESHRFKTPGAKITKIIVSSGKHAKHKRILSGTSVTNSPFDVYSQVKFLDPTFWPRHDFGSYQSFKTTFGVFKEVTFFQKKTGQEKAFQQLIYYRNLDYLCKILKEISDRHLTSEVLDLPERTFTRRYFEPSAEQKRMYKDLAKDFYTFIEESDEMITTQLAITRMVRFQQLLSGFLVRDIEEGGGKILLRDNPRLDCLLDILENEVPAPKKVIIWCRFRFDIDCVMGKLGEAAVRFDGAVNTDDRLANRRRFESDPDCRFFVSNPAAGGTGLTLNSARTVIYYTNSFNLEHWLQSLGRNYRVGQMGTVLVMNILARGLPFDGNLLTRLRSKHKMLSKVMGDELVTWI